MGQKESKEAAVNESSDEDTDVNPGLKDVTLRGVIPLNDELGHGAYGSVFTVQHGGVICAAKKIHPILIDESVSNEEKQAIKDDFIRECLCCSSILHPNIVRFLGVYFQSTESTLPIMVMELMDTSLTKFVNCNKSSISFPKKISILYDVSLGLSFLHNHKPQILHRDLSPNNIMLTTELVAKIGDLGVAKVVRAGSKETISKLKLTRAVPGTPEFMPPEALEVDSNYGTPIDVFSFGGLALYVFSEEWPSPSPLKQKDVNTKKMVALTEIQRRQQYMDRMAGVDGKLRKMVEDCLDDDPDKRPPIQEVSNTIERFKVQCLHIACVCICLCLIHMFQAAFKLCCMYCKIFRV